MFSSADICLFALIIEMFWYCLDVSKTRVMLWYSVVKIDIANECVLMFNCSVYDMVLKRKSKFLNKLKYNENTLCKMFQNNIQVELSELSALYCT